MDPARPTSASGSLASSVDTVAAIVNEQAAPAVSAPAGYFRWVICGLLLLGTTKNYMDRWLLSSPKSTLPPDLRWTEPDYSHLAIAFLAASAVGRVAFVR